MAIDLYYDFHLHSCLSPCGDMDMTPQNIAGMAALKELDAVALTDHNTCKNCPAFLEAAKAYSFVAIPGMELCTLEEVHVVCLFPDLEGAMAFDQYVDGKLPEIQNEPEIYGKQVIMDQNENAVGEVEKLLVNAASIGLDEVIPLVQAHRGICFPAHIDRPSYSILAMLGDFPPELDFTTAELANPLLAEQYLAQYPRLQTMRLVTDSDAHYLWDISEREHAIVVAHKSIESIFETLRGQREGAK